MQTQRIKNTNLSSWNGTKRGWFASEMVRGLHKAATCNKNTPLFNKASQKAAGLGSEKKSSNKCVTKDEAVDRRKIWSSSGKKTIKLESGGLLRFKKKKAKIFCFVFSLYSTIHLKKLNKCNYYTTIQRDNSTAPGETRDLEKLLGSYRTSCDQDRSVKRRRAVRKVCKLSSETESRNRNAESCRDATWAPRFVSSLNSWRFLGNELKRI